MIHIQEIIQDKSRLFLGEDVPEAYMMDQYIQNIPKIYGVALPVNHDEVVALVKYANQEDLVIIARGAGTGVAGGQVPIRGNELLID